MRQTMVQDYNMNSVGVQPADFVLAPDVTSFDMSAFTQADEMARIGEATRHRLPRDCEIKAKDILGGLHHEYWPE